MKNIKRLLAVTLLGLSLSMPAGAAETKAMDVVASFSILADMVRQVGGPYVDVTTLVDRNSDAHTWSPSPAAARAVATADLVVVNGLGFEGWLDRLIQASGYSGPVVVASKGVNAIPGHHHHHHGHAHDHHHAHAHHHEHDHGHEHDHAHHHGHDHGHTHPHAGHHHGKYNPHAWLDAANGVIYVRNIADALANVDPAHAEAYYRRAKDYIMRLLALHDDIKEMIASLPEDQRTVVVPHSAFGYFSRAYGIEFLAPIGLSTASAASAGDMAELIRIIREKGIDAIFRGNITDPRLIQQIARETGAEIRGTLYSDALSGVDGPASTYIELLRYDAQQIISALRADNSAQNRDE